MPRSWAIALSAVLTINWLAMCRGGDWIFDPGPYTLDPKTGQRVDQFKQLPQVNRIPFRTFFSEDGPHPFGMDWWWGGPYWYGGGYLGYGYGMSPYAWGGYPYGGPFIYPLGMP